MRLENKVALISGGARGIGASIAGIFAGDVARSVNGDVIDGDPNAVVNVGDFWTFSRNTKSRDPNWTLVATSSLD